MQKTELPSVRLTQSLAVRTLLAFTLIVGVMLASMLGGMYLSESIRGDAEALNKAGSLRMQAYRLALLAGEPVTEELAAYIAEFENSLVNPAVMAAITNNGYQNLTVKYARVQQQWHQLMLPLIEQQPPQKVAFRHEVPIFVELLDGFVGELQRESEQKLSLIRGLFIGSLFFTVLIGFIVILGVNNALLMPLQELVDLAKRIGHGSFEGRAKVTARNELGVLAWALNQMSTELSDLYSNLESKVDLKTTELQRSNRSLELLFNSARSLYKTSVDPLVIFTDLLKPIEQTLGLGSVYLCLSYSSDNPSREAHTALTAQRGQAPTFCKLPNCAQCPLSNNQGVTPSGVQVISFALETDLEHLGDLRVEVPYGLQVQEWQVHLLEALTELFSASLSLHQLGENQARIALMEERTVIARELHDSLAQSLSYQKIQLVRLKKQMVAEHSKEDINETLLEIQNGVSSAYRQLRELLVTFRIKLDAPTLAAAIQATVQEFSRYAGLDIQLSYALEHCPLTPNEEIHCLQIIREALSNVVKHAQADNCKLSLYQDADGHIHIRVDDDGVGINTASSPEGHYGLNILAERTQSLLGEIHIERLQPGTRVHVQFLPDYKRSQVEQEIDFEQLG